MEVDRFQTRSVARAAIRHVDVVRDPACEPTIWAGGERDATFVDADDSIDDQIGDAYRSKYRRYAPSIVGSVLTPEARSAMIKLVPRSRSFL